MHTDITTKLITIESLLSHKQTMHRNDAHRFMSNSSCHCEKISNHKVTQYK